MTTLQEAIKSFKPQFGNIDHINIVEALGKISQKKLRFLNLETDSRAWNNLNSEIGRDERNVIWNIEKVIHKPVVKRKSKMKRD